MEKRTLLVTGANRGIGLAIVQELSRDKNDLVLLGCRDLDSGNKLAKETGENVKAVELDLSTREGLRSNVEQISSSFGNIDCLINNAGILVEGTMEQLTFDRFDESIRVNFMAPFELSSYFLPSMIRRKYGRIVNVSSGWGSFSEGLDGPMAYSISKASLNALTLSLSKNLPPNILVNSMCPGWVRTRMGGESATRSPEEGAQTAVWLANLENDGPNGGFFRDKKPINW